MWSTNLQEARADSCLMFADYIGLQAAVIKGSNFVFSPLSIRAALSLAAVGSRGQTLDQFLSFLGSHTVQDLNAAMDRLLGSVHGDATDDDGTHISFVNGVWVDRSLTLKPVFQDVAASVYDAVATSIDFRNKPLEAVEQVNAWVQANTNELIKNLIPEDAVDNHTRVILANALYFRAPWAEKFDRSKTTGREFHLLDGRSVRVPFMTFPSWMMDQFIASFDGFKVLKLPYLYEPNPTGRNFSMLVVLPDKRDGLRSLIQKAVASPGFFDSHIPTTRVKATEFMIPKFKISAGFKANEALWDMGLRSPFTGEADLTKMAVCPEGNLYISSVHHKATIEVGEDGTEASAATGVVMRMQCGSLTAPVDFVADHPFMFAIREERTGAVLFLGHVVNPLEVEAGI